MFCEKYDEFINELQIRGFTVHTAKSGEEAKEIALSLIGSDSVGCGGSVTVSSLNIPEELRSRGNKVYFHWDEKPEDRPETFKKAAAADWYICSTNAITADAKLINTDANGNRVAAMFSGPKKVMLIIGKNKLSPDISSAFERVKSVACVNNARRFKLNTPCAINGKCLDCKSPQRLCVVTTIIESKPKFVEQMHLILVDENLGY